MKQSMLFSTDYYWADSDSDCAQGKGRITREKL